MTHNLHVCTTCCRPEVVYDVISGKNVKTIVGYLLVNFEDAGSIIFLDIPPKSFRYGGRAAAAAEADIDDSTKRKHFRVSLKNGRNAASDGFAVVCLENRLS